MPASGRVPAGRGDGGSASRARSVPGPGAMQSHPVLSSGGPLPSSSAEQEPWKSLFPLYASEPTNLPKGPFPTIGASGRGRPAGRISGRSSGAGPRHPLWWGPWAEAPDQLFRWKTPTEDRRKKLRDKRHTSGAGRVATADSGAATAPGRGRPDPPAGPGGVRRLDGHRVASADGAGPGQVGVRLRAHDRVQPRRAGGLPVPGGGTAPVWPDGSCPDEPPPRPGAASRSSARRWATSGPGSTT